MSFRNLFSAILAHLIVATTAMADQPSAFRDAVEPLRQQGYTVSVVVPIYSQLLSMSFPRGFKPAFEKSTGGFYIQESVPEGENVKKWTQMITLTGNQGLASNSDLTPLKYADRVAAGFKRSCPETFNSSGLGAIKLSGYEAFAALIGCGIAVPTGEPYSEAVLIVVMRGEKDYYTIQWAERGKASSTPLELGDAKWADRLKQLAPIKLCPIVPGEPAPYPSCTGRDQKTEAISNTPMPSGEKPVTAAKIIGDMLQMHRGKTMCIDEATPMNTIQAKVIGMLRSTGASNTVTGKDIGLALWALFPCPFSPSRPELRFAKSSDVEGVWVFPETSQKFRFGPQSPKWSRPPGIPPLKCDAVGLYPSGEYRHTQVMGSIKCPFEKTADMDASRGNPRVASWSMPNDGRIRVTRTDITDHVEEWEVFSVIAPFNVDGVQFESGDLVAYLRREKGNEVGAATHFRHLRRLN